MSDLTFIVNSESSAKTLIYKLLDHDEDFVYETLDTYAGEEAVIDFNAMLSAQEFMDALMLLEQVELVEFSFRNGMIVVSVDWVEALPGDFADMGN